VQPYDAYRGRPPAGAPSGPVGPVGPPTLYPLPAGSRMTPLQWADANDHWRAKRVHPHGVAEHFPFGTVLWATNGRGPLGLVLADPGQPVSTAHRVAAEIAATHVRALGQTVPRTAMWGGVASAVPTVTVVGSIDAVAPLMLPAAAAAGVLAAYGVGRRRRIRTQRSSWRHVYDPAGASACLPHLRWLCDLTDQVPDQAALVWSGVRDILWTAPALQAAAPPVEQVSVALARTARARSHRDAAALDGLPRPELDPRVSRLDDIAAGVVEALGFEEEVYRRTTDDLTRDSRDPEAGREGDGPST